MKFRSFHQVIQEAQKTSPVHVSVAAAHDKDVLLAIQEAVELNIIVPHLVGVKEDILRISEEMGFPGGDYPIYEAETENECAFIAAKLADEGTCQLVMKGMVNSTPFLKGVLNKELNLKTGRTLSHLSTFDIPNTDHLVYMTDGGLNIAPDVHQKTEIITNATEFLRKVGISMPKVALLAANERVNEKMPVTTESVEVINHLKHKGIDSEMVVEGPLPLDLAISKQSLEHKGLASKLNGEADLLVVPSIEAGNIFGKAITYFAQGVMAGIVLGAKVPLILVSRSDSPRAKLASLALAVVAVSEGEGIGE